MTRLALFLFLLLATPLVAFAQEPVFTWGAAIDREPREFQNMHVVGMSQDSGFYATYSEEGKTTLERYNKDHQRMWATVLLPRTPENQAAVYHDAIVLQHKVYIISTRLNKGTTTVFAQEITANGNYVPQIQPLLQAKHAGSLHLATTQANDLLLATLSDPAKKTTTVSLLAPNLKPRWERSFSTRATAVQTHLLDNGNAYVLAKSLPSESSTRSFLLYRLQGGSKPEEIAIGQEKQRPLQAKLTTTASQDVVVAGYYSSVAEAAAKSPILAGTFYYRFEPEQPKKQVIRYTPFSAKELIKHNRYKQDPDSTKWLRHLQLKQLLPVPYGGVIVLGEVTYPEATPATLLQHQEDVLAVMLEEDGTPYYTTSIYKKQTSPNNSENIGSFMATNTGNYLQLLYLDFEYNFTDDDKLIIAGENASNKEPVLITILSNGEQQVKPLHNSQTGREQQHFYLRPTSAYRISEKEFIVLGIGPGYYKYGRLKFK